MSFCLLCAFPVIASAAAAFHSLESILLSVEILNDNASAAPKAYFSSEPSRTESQTAFASAHCRAPFLLQQ